MTNAKNTNAFTRPNNTGRSTMGNNVIWTIVGILLIVALSLYLITEALAVNSL
jgi:hypothetical protein